jgi:hypothetical protein
LNEDKIIDAITGGIAIVIIGLLALNGLVPPDEAIRYILLIVGLIIGRQGIGLAYSIFKARSK